MKIERQTGCRTRRRARPATGSPWSLRRASEPRPPARAAQHQPPAIDLPWPPSGGRLIANLELEFGSSDRKHSELQIPTRKSLPLFYPDGVTPSARSRSSRASPEDGPRLRRAPRRSPVLRRSRADAEPLSTAFLIGTLQQSENRSTHTKQTTKQISNRYKTRILRLPRRAAVASFSKGFSLVTSHQPLVIAFRPAPFRRLPHLIAVSTSICTLNERN